ncbi:MAG: tetratricopeptide repeat protein [Kofleriaceae bacterium]
MSDSDFVAKGQALVSAGQYQEAVKICRLGLLGRPTTVEGRIVLGQALLALRRYDEVLAEVRVALDLDHKSVAARLLKAEALLRKGDHPAAIDVLTKLRAEAPGAGRIAELLGEAQRGSSKSPPAAAHRSVGFVGDSTSDEDTQDEATASVTEQTSIAAPAARQRSHAEVDPAFQNRRSGTIDVPSAADGVFVEEDDDLGTLAPPPSSMPRGRNPGPSRPPPGRKPLRKDEVSSVELDSNELEEVPLPPLHAPDRGVPAPPVVPAGPSLPANRTMLGQNPPRAGLPGLPTARKPVTLPPPFGAPGAATPPSPPSPPGAPSPVSPAMPPGPVSAPRPLVPMSAVQSQLPIPIAPPAAAPWASTMVSGPGSAERAPVADIDPQLAALLSGRPPAKGRSNGPEMFEPAPPPLPERSPTTTKTKPPKPKRARSKLSLAIWVLIGAVVIGGGVFAGFQIRAIRLRKQIAAARDQAVDLARTDTWRGWTGAKGRLSDIAGASATIDNRAALARSRGVLAFEFGDGLAEAKGAIDRLAGQGGLDAALAASYVALAQHDVKAATDAAARAAKLDPNGAAVAYVTGQAALLAGNDADAIAALRRAYEREPRPAYGLAVAHVLASTGEIDKALETIDRVIGQVPNHPGALLQHAQLLIASGRATATTGPTSAAELRKTIAAIINEGNQPAADQPRGVSPAQAAFAGLVLAHLDFLLRDPAAVKRDIADALERGIDERRFAEHTVDTLFAVGDLAAARRAAELALAIWPTSRRVLLAQTQIAVAGGRPWEAIATLGRAPEVAASPAGLAVRGTARLAMGDTAAAQADFEAALKANPNYDAALIGRAWVDLANGDAPAALKRVEPRYKPGATAPDLAIAYGAALRALGDKASRERAKQVLEVVAGEPGGYLVASAQLELGRLHRDLGDTSAAGAAFDAAAQAGNLDARIEAALLQIENGAPELGSDVMHAIVREAGDKVSAAVLLEAARARILTGNHAEGAALLDQADRTPNVVRWKYDRERGRLALRKGDVAKAVQDLDRALAVPKSDAETLLLAADAATSDIKKHNDLVADVRTAAAKRFKATPEAAIVDGKLALADAAAAEPGSPEATKAMDEARLEYETARALLESTKASKRRMAQAEYGLAVIAYQSSDDATAAKLLDGVTTKDPTLYNAYLFAAEITRGKRPQKALPLAQAAVKFNPDILAGWVMVGRLAAATRKIALLDEVIAKIAAQWPTAPELGELQTLRR